MSFSDSRLRHSYAKFILAFEERILKFDLMQKPPPCYQDWDAMAKVPGGRLCAQCDKTIVDFSKKTWQDILEIQKASEFSTCGKYSTKQIRHWGYQPPVTDLAWFRKFSFTSLLVLLGLKSVDAQVESEHNTAYLQVISKDALAADISRKSVYRGIVFDSSSGEPLVGAVIRPKEGSGGAISDENGCFLLEVDQVLMVEDSLNVTIQYFGLTTLQVALKANTIDSFYLVRSEAKTTVIHTHFRVESSAPTLKSKPFQGFGTKFFKKD
jgi:hypothetical protein